ncbi:hypothetical protein RHGRI_001026 [Rhododendron griersonianum]|uniref:Protein kinase domain-containing protein n=1 Tax=Rhododendron griersonianum TaxID=479676 RepID=A0AAV6LJ56_9ERIC|nr:hypothetical protein RHGRI_001026 [Rhododendron griersonianum]
MIACELDSVGISLAICLSLGKQFLSVFWETRGFGDLGEFPSSTIALVLLCGFTVGSHVSFESFRISDGQLMASVGVAPASGLRESQMVGVDRLPKEMNDMKIRNDKEMEATVVDGNGTETGHIIVTTIGGQNGQPKQGHINSDNYWWPEWPAEAGKVLRDRKKCSYKVLQDKRYKNRELQTMRLLDHPNVVSLKHCFFSTTEKDELYLNLVLEYVPETVHCVIKHYNKLTQRIPLIYVKLYTCQIACELDSVGISPAICLSLGKQFLFVFWETRGSGNLGESPSSTVALVLGGFFGRGKTGINHRLGKNLIGAFCQPQ